MTMKTYEVVGYTLNGECYCSSCATNYGVGFDFPLFAGDETELARNCHDCLDEIESNKLV